MSHSRASSASHHARPSCKGHPQATVWQHESHRSSRQRVADSLPAACAVESAVQQPRQGGAQVAAAPPGRRTLRVAHRGTTRYSTAAAAQFTATCLGVLFKHDACNGPQPIPHARLFGRRDVGAADVAVLGCIQLEPCDSDTKGRLLQAFSGGSGLSRHSASWPTGHSLHARLNHTLAPPDCTCPPSHEPPATHAPVSASSRAPCCGSTTAASMKKGAVSSSLSSWPCSSAGSGSTPGRGKRGGRQHVGPAWPGGWLMDALWELQALPLHPVSCRQAVQAQQPALLWHALLPAHPAPCSAAACWPSSAPGTAPAGLCPPAGRAPPRPWHQGRHRTAPGRRT